MVNQDTCREGPPVAEKVDSILPVPDSTGNIDITPVEKLCKSDSAAASRADTGDCLGKGVVNDVDPMFPFVVNIAVSTQLINVYSNMDIGEIIQVHKLGWPQPDLYTTLMVTLKESNGPRTTTFKVARDCFVGTCSCVHVLDGLSVSMKPCRVFTECFMWGVVDPNWLYILEGSVYGFRVVNPDCPCSYENENYDYTLKGGRKKFMSDKLVQEIS